MPHLVINGFKNVLAIALGTEYSFPQADKVGRHAASRIWGPGTTLQVAALRGVQPPQHTCHDMSSTDTPTPSAVSESQIKEILENPELLAAATAASAAPAGGDGGSKEEAKEEAKEEVRIRISISLLVLTCCVCSGGSWLHGRVFAVWQIWLRCVVPVKPACAKRDMLVGQSSCGVQLTPLLTGVWLLVHVMNLKP